MKNKEKLAEKFIWKNGAVKFDFKNRTLLFNDGGLFSIEKKIVKLPRSKFVKVKEGKFKGMTELKHIKGPKVKHEDYDATLWFEELRETINYLKRLEKFLIKLGYDTNGKYKINSSRKSNKC